MTRSQFLSKITALHDQFQFSETSGWRTAARNKAVGGAPKSKHLTGAAIDCVLDIPTQTRFFTAAVKAAGLAYLNEGDHIHVQIPRGTVLEEESK